MNHQKTLYTGLILSLAASALSGTAVLADDPTLNDTAAAHTRIVATNATTADQPLSRALRDAHAEAQDAAVQAALQGVLTDSRTELEMRLARHKSVILTAGL